MADAPQVQALQDLVTQYTTAQAPQQQQLDTQIQNNDQSGTAQTAGINAAKTNAFGGITQQAQNRGMYFSGFTPDAEAKYTASTYLPALAKLQQTIDATKTSLLGQKANLSATANTNALNTQKSEQGALDAWNTQQATIAAKQQRQREAEAAAERQAQASQAFTAQQNSLNRQASAVKAAQITPAQQQAQQQAQDFAAANAYLQGKWGADKKVSPATFAAARNSWVNAGYSAASFNSNFGNYINNSHAQDYK